MAGQFDTIVIILSLVALGPFNMPISVLRLVRAFRVIRLFGRMRQLKRILSALSASILPELNALMIMFIVVSICECPERFPRGMRFRSRAGCDFVSYEDIICVVERIFRTHPRKYDPATT